MTYEYDILPRPGEPVPLPGEINRLATNNAVALALLAIAERIETLNFLLEQLLDEIAHR